MLILAKLSVKATQRYVSCLKGKQDSIKSPEKGIGVPLQFDFDWRAPDYRAVLAHRFERLAYLRGNKHLLPGLKKFYKENPAQFIIDWGCTADPRNIERNHPAVVPFILFPKQEEWVEWLMDKWRRQSNGITEKSRDMGLSWLSVATACTLCLFNDDITLGFGSRKEEYVDKIGAPKSLFHKARQFMSLLPVEFTGQWQSAKNAPFLRINFPETGSHISGEAGDGIGRGDRTAIYFVDEAAYLDRPELVEASLSATTNCRIDISSANGMGNPFAQKRHSGRIDVFTFHWRDDPRKDDAWYAKQKEQLDPITLAQEVDIDYTASVEGLLIPGVWVRSAIDAHLKLGVEITGARSGAFDVADCGKDVNAFCGAHGILIETVDFWSGKDDDIFGSVQKVFTLCDVLGYDSFRFDSDGLGAGVRGDARIVNEKRDKAIEVEPFRGSESPTSGSDVRGIRNKDLFANRKAQAWWALRTRFQNTFRAVVEGMAFDPDEIISIDSKCRNLNTLVMELSQPTYSKNSVGKIVVDKTPDGTKSPNMADTVMMQFASSKKASIVLFNNRQGVRPLHISIFAR